MQKYLSNFELRVYVWSAFFVFLVQASRKKRTLNVINNLQSRNVARKNVADAHLANFPSSVHVVNYFLCTVSTCVIFCLMNYFFRLIDCALSVKSANFSAHLRKLKVLKCILRTVFSKIGAYKYYLLIF